MSVRFHKTSTCIAINIVRADGDTTKINKYTSRKFKNVIFRLNIKKHNKSSFI